MSRLKHPITSLKEPFGKAGLTVAILALVLAMAGGAYAAGGLTKSQEKQVTKIAKKFAGKPGANGAAGAAGTNGTNGTNGAPGKLGPEGKQGIPGNPAEYPKVLPAKQTEMGAWNVMTTSGTPPFFGVVLGSPISFPIPLEAALAASRVHYVSQAGQEIVEGSSGPEEVPSTQCLGNAAAPTAKPGNLCVYEQEAFHLQHAKNAAEVELAVIQSFIFPAGSSPLAGNGTSKFGTGLAFEAEGEGGQLADGTWAVTAE